MNNNFKAGGGNKLQPYIPSGNGEKSGEYTNKPTNQTKRTFNCFIRNVRFKCNFKHSKLVGKVEHFLIADDGLSIPRMNKPFTVIKKIINGYVVNERYYNSKGEAYLDIDYTNHGNPATHPEVPHIHRWIKNQDGNLERKSWESFQ